MADLPRGTVAFLFTDVEGSTRLWERDPAAMAPAVARHFALLGAAAAAHGGVAFKTVGDAIQAAFADPAAAVAAAADGQRALATEAWPPGIGPLRVRMAVHLGEAEPDGHGDYLAPCLNRLARLLAAGHGGQVLLTEAVRRRVEGRLPDGVALVDLGRHRLRDLLEPELVTQLAVAGLPDRFPPLASLGRHPTNLPVQPTELVGRVAELGTLRELLLAANARLVTLTGPGGVGKTRLALQAAADLLDAFADGAFFVDLAAVADPALVLPEIAQALGVREGGGRSLREALVAYVGDKHLLLVLDNCEQVVVGAPTVADVLGVCPRLVVVATSRAPLRLRGEREVPVAPLALPDPRRLPPVAELARVPAVALFVARAQAASPGFALTADNAPAVAELCARLDGLPLAIELAAARSKLLPPRALLARLGRRLDVLTGGARDLPDRQRTLRAAIAWSHNLLAPSERALFRRLAAFAGDWTEEAAEAVCGPRGSGVGGQGAGASSSPAPCPPTPDPSVFDGLSALVDQNLVRATAPPDGEPRFAMLETIREYAAERLAASGEAAAVRAAHADHFLALAEAAAPGLGGPAPEEWLTRLEADHDNLRAALGWAEEMARPAVGLRLGGALWRFWLVRGHLTEGRRWLDAALAADAAVPAEVRLAALTGAGALAQTQGAYEAAEARFEDGLALAERCGDRAATAFLLNGRAGVALARGELDRAEELYGRSLALCAELGDRRRYANALGNLGAVAHYRGDLATAAARYEESLAIRRQVGDKAGAATALFNLLALLAPEPAAGAKARAYGKESLRLARELGDAQGEAYALTGLALVAETAGELDRAAALHEESLARFRELGDRSGVARALGNLGLVVHDRGAKERGLALCRDSLREFAALGEQDSVAFALEAVAAILGAGDDPARAARLYGAAEALRERIGVALPPETRRRYEAAVTALRRRLGAARFDAVWAEGRALPPPTATDEALGEPVPATLEPVWPLAL